MMAEHFARMEATLIERQLAIQRAPARAEIERLLARQRKSQHIADVQQHRPIVTRLLAFARWNGHFGSFVMQTRSRTTRDSSSRVSR